MEMDFPPMDKKWIDQNNGVTHFLLCRFANKWSMLGRVIRREQISSIAIELTFAPPQINKR